MAKITIIAQEGIDIALATDCVARCLKQFPSGFGLIAFEGLDLLVFEQPRKTSTTYRVSRILRER